ncbi:hypothetical protein Sjap_008225 [Stephania japonica]|uniref:Uncharacterized protein n=1 Tax=Stephania japonica TaxID=461633 RepID=A0AAP0JP36_9MAGN
MIRKFAFDFYMSIPIWMSNIEEVVKVICMFMKHGELHPSHFCARRMTKVFKRWMILKGIVGSRYRLIIKTNAATMEGSRASGVRQSLQHKVHRVDAQVEEESGATNLCYEMRHGGDTCRSWESEDFQARFSKRRRIGTPRSKARDLDPRSTVVVPCHLRLPKKDCDSSETPPSVNDLYLHLHTVNHDRTTFIDTRSERFYDRLQSRRQELTQATPEQSVDDEAVYLNVAGECSKGRVYGLGSVGRKKRRYGTPGASTSQTPDVVPRAEFDVVAEQLRKVMNFMHQHLGMDMDEIGLAQQQPPPPPPTPPPHDQQQSRRK